MAAPQFRGHLPSLLTVNPQSQLEQGRLLDCDAPSKSPTLQTANSMPGSYEEQLISPLTEKTYYGSMASPDRIYEEKLTPTSVDLQVVHINIADYTILLKTENEAMAERLRERYADFLVDGGDPVASITLNVIPGAEFLELIPGPWIIESEYSDEGLTYRSYMEKGAVDWRTKQGHLDMHPNAHVENFLRVIYAWLCLQDGGLLLHAAGLIRNGDGFVFFGPSGAGKTTTTRLSADQAEILSDDLVVLRCNDGKCMLFGVPFKGDYSDAPRANQRAELKAIFRLKQDSAHYLESLPHVTAVAELVASSPFVVRDLGLSQKLIAVCQQIAETVPVQLLHFQRDNGFWREIDEHYQDIPEAASANGRASR